MVISFSQSNVSVTQMTQLRPIPTYFLKSQSNSNIVTISPNIYHWNHFIEKWFRISTWCSARSIAGKGNSQNSQVTILWRQFSPLWIARISRSIVSLHSEQATCSHTYGVNNITNVITCIMLDITVDMHLHITFRHTKARLNQPKITLGYTKSGLTVLYPLLSIIKGLIGVFLFSFIFTHNISNLHWQ